MAMIRSFPVPISSNMSIATINIILWLPNGTAVSNKKVFVLMPTNALLRRVLCARHSRPTHVINHKSCWDFFNSEINVMKIVCTADMPTDTCRWKTD